MELRCPKGHASTDPDYCSECGSKISGAPRAATATPALAREAQATTCAGDACPVCATPRVAAARFCEVCRYDFDNAAPSAVAAPVGAAPAAAVPAAATPQPDQAAVPAQSAQAPPPPASESVPQRWDAVIVVDPSLYAEPDPAQPCPAGQPQRIFPLYMDDNLVGRRDDRREIRPEIVIVDPGVSHRHLSFRRRNDGGFSVLELGSANGTTLNEIRLEAGIETPLTDGDQLTLGCWTRITIRAR